MYGRGVENRAENDRYSKLTPENFWDKIKKDHPDEYNKFAEWIDEYKKRNDWLKLFGDNSKSIYLETKRVIAPKVHDLPVAMQVGIFIQYIQESECITSFKPDLDDMESFAQCISKWFREESGVHKFKFEPGRKIGWDSDPSSDECIIFKGTVISDDGKFVEVDSPMYQKYHNVKSSKLKLQKKYVYGVN